MVRGELDKVLARSDAFSEKIKHALGVIKECIKTYGFAGTALSFNGGKDCMVIVHLLFAALEDLIKDKLMDIDASRSSVATLYITPTDPFHEVEEFVENAAEKFKLDMVHISSPMKEGLQHFLNTHPDVKAILIGTRRTDPYAANLKDFAPSDNGWPSVMRVHPILDWDYQAIWKYILEVKVPYCELYDKGYTSLGGVSNTLPNPALKNDSIECGYDPAYKLSDGSLERAGRIKR
ncbi:hypothetical protein HDU76_012701 [Blyttiomyces sp. JEL0837]|nr:hypothetical protein HDU76_012701 [Blyttiomyces sp. JEL0837]